MINNSFNEYSVSQTRINDLVECLIRNARGKGIDLSHPKTTIFNFNYNGKGTLEEELFKKLKKDCKLVIILIPKREEIYAEIKAVAELSMFGFGMITQCLNQENKYFNSRDGTFSTQLIDNILLKINSKCNGTNHSIRLRPPILTDSIMIIGLDVTHPSPTDGLNKSVAGICASYTEELDKCFHKLVIQEKARKEVVKLKEIAKVLLDNYQKVRKSYPKKILVLRDGIGEGDFKNVIKYELGSIQEACRELKQAIKITYIMVQKRHNARFMPENVNAQGKPKEQNVKPGTVVDSVITHHKFWEFYICSHAGNY